MAILTITTDWGLRDHYLASFKGELFSSLPAIQVVDISHDIEKFNTMQAAFVVRNSFRKFPKGTIHLIGLSSNSNSHSENPYVIVKTDQQYLIGEDNGIFTLILETNEKEIFRLPWKKNMERGELVTSFIDILVKLSNNTEAKLLGKQDTKLEESYFTSPMINNDAIRGTIIYIDSFGNAFVNVDKQLFTNQIGNKKFTISFRKSMYNVSSISSSYEDVEVGEMLALFNQDGYLEIALNKGSASQLLGLKLMDPIHIEIGDHTNS